MKKQMLNCASVISIPVFLALMAFYIGLSKGNHGNYGNFWTSTVFGVVVGAAVYGVMLVGFVSTCYMVYSNFNDGHFVWLALNGLSLIGWLVILYCIIGGLLGYF